MTRDTSSDEGHEQMVGGMVLGEAKKGKRKRTPKSLRGPLGAGEALLEARTQASVAFFKLGAHSDPNLEGRHEI